MTLWQALSSILIRTLWSITMMWFLAWVKARRILLSSSLAILIRRKDPLRRGFSTGCRFLKDWNRLRLCTRSCHIRCLWAILRHFVWLFTRYWVVWWHSLATWGWMHNWSTSYIAKEKMVESIIQESKARMLTVSLIKQSKRWKKASYQQKSLIYDS